MADTLHQQLQDAIGQAYTLERELGGGGMSRVFVAEEARFRRRVVIKILPPERAAGVSVGRFQREIAVAARLQQANIVPVITAGEMGGLPWYAMPFVDGESLRDRMSRGLVPVGEALRILEGVACALAHAHAQGIVHRDIKPENVLLSGGTAVVTDFGIAKALEGARAGTPASEGATRPGTLTAVGATLGTPAYMAPEQALGDVVDHRADIYAWGVLAYELMAGRHPFADRVSLQQLIAAHVTELPAPLRTVRPDVPPALAAVVMQALAKDPAMRPPSAQALVAAVSAAARPAGGGAARRASTLAAIAAVGLLGALAAVGAWRSRAGAEGGPAPHTIAVLYLENLSPDTLDRYLADGLTEELISSLGALEPLRVKSRNAVARFRGASDRAGAGSALDVDYLMEGSVRRSGSRVRVVARLLAARSGNLLWEGRYDRTTADVLAIQEEIAREVTQAVAGKLQPDDRRRLAQRATRSPAAYDEFLKGNFQLARRTPSSMAAALAHYEAALRLDPRFTDALAATGYAAALALDLDLRVRGIPHDTLLARGLRAADRALREDSLSSAAWMARGYLLSFSDPVHMRGAPEALRRAVALDPRNAEALHQLGWILQELGDDRAAVESFRRALATDPDRPSTLWHLGRAHIITREYDAARVWLDSAVRMDPHSVLSHTMRSFLNSIEGRAADALADAHRASALDGGIFGEAALAIAEARGGRLAEGRRRAHRMRDSTAAARPVPVVAAWLTGMALVAVGDTADAFTLLERAEPRGAHLAFDLRWPLFDPVRSARRFQALEAESRSGTRPR